MIQHYIATFLIYCGIILSVIGWFYSFPMLITGYIMVFLFPFITNEEYEMKVWEKEYL